MSKNFRVGKLLTIDCFGVESVFPELPIESISVDLKSFQDKKNSCLHHSVTVVQLLLSFVEKMQLGLPEKANFLLTKIKLKNNMHPLAGNIYKIEHMKAL